jgi:hypothetical protein
LRSIAPCLSGVRMQVGFCSINNSGPSSPLGGAPPIGGRGPEAGPGGPPRGGPRGGPVSGPRFGHTLKTTRPWGGRGGAPGPRGGAGGPLPGGYPPGDPLVAALPTDNTALLEPPPRGGPRGRPVIGPRYVTQQPRKRPGVGVLGGPLGGPRGGLGGAQGASGGVRGPLPGGYPPGGPLVAALPTDNTALLEPPPGGPFLGGPVSLGAKSS